MTGCGAKGKGKGGKGCGGVTRTTPTPITTDPTHLFLLSSPLLCVLDGSAADLSPGAYLALRGGLG